MNIQVHIDGEKSKYVPVVTAGLDYNNEHAHALIILNMSRVNKIKARGT